MTKYQHVSYHVSPLVLAHDNFRCVKPRCVFMKCKLFGCFELKTPVFGWLKPCKTQTRCQPNRTTTLQKHLDHFYNHSELFDTFKSNKHNFQNHGKNDHHLNIFKRPLCVLPPRSLVPSRVQETQSGASRTSEPSGPTP